MSRSGMSGRLLVDRDEAALAGLGRGVDRAGPAADGDGAASGRTAPVRILTRVLLPAPLAPMSAWTSPGRTASEASFRATTAPYVLAMPVASSSRSVVTRSSGPLGGGSARAPAWPAPSRDGLGGATRPGPCRRRPARGCTWCSPRSGDRAARAGRARRPATTRAVALPASLTLSARTGIEQDGVRLAGGRVGLDGLTVEQLERQADARATDGSGVGHRGARQALLV